MRQIPLGSLEDYQLLWVASIHPSALNVLFQIPQANTVLPPFCFNLAIWQQVVWVLFPSPEVDSWAPSNSISCRSEVLLQNGSSQLTAGRAFDERLLLLADAEDRIIILDSKPSNTCIPISLHLKLDICKNDCITQNTSLFRGISNWSCLPTMCYSEHLGN